MRRKAGFKAMSMRTNNNWCLKNGSRRGNEADGCARLPGNPPRYLGGYGAWGFCRHAPRRNMKLIPSFAILAALAALGVSSPNLQAAEEDGVALAILYDTSGSMKEAVPDKDGKPAPKYIIANRALIAISKQVQAFATNSSSGAARRIDASLIT